MTIKRLPKKYNIPGLTRKQKEWLWRYEGVTMLEPLDLDELRANPTKFNEFARWNIQHYEDHSADALRAIDRDVPYNDEPEPLTLTPEEVIQLIDRTRFVGGCTCRVSGVVGSTILIGGEGGCPVHGFGE